MKKILYVGLLTVVLFLLFIASDEYKFKKDVYIGMNPNEIEDIYGNPSLLFNDETYIIYTYRNFLNKTVFVFDKYENKLITKWRENWYFFYGNEINH